MMVVLKSERELALMRQSNRIVAEVLCTLQTAVQPGISTFELDRIAEDVITQHKASAAFKGYHGFPNALCVSINDEIVHGIPSKTRVLKDGDLVSLDFGVIKEGYFGDAAITVPVGTVSTTAQRLMAVTHQSLYAAIKACRDGNRLYQLAQEIEKIVAGTGFSIVREFVGHGIGRKLHEPPQVLNYYDSNQRLRLKPGMVLAIEPMITEGTPDVRLRKDKWTAVTADGKLSAHFEHSVAITSDGPEVLSWLACYGESSRLQ